VWTPHVGGSVTDPMTKKVVSRVSAKAAGTVAFGDAYGPMAAGFAGVVSDPKGTAYDAFRGLSLAGPVVAGKTGTAEVTGKGSSSVFASYFPADNPQYAVVALVEQGGHGAQIAAPIVREVIESIQGLPITPIPTLQTGKD
jgi:penicillin-binding protein 2